MISPADPDDPPALSAPPELVWRVHLLRRDPGRLLGLALVLFLGGVCVWLMFGSLLPVLAALLLLTGASAEYLFPTTYYITDAGVRAEAVTTRLALPWADARRCLPLSVGLLVSPLPAASRLDRFRGVLLRFAPDGEPGDRQSLRAAMTRFAPDLLAQTRAEPVAEINAEPEDASSAPTGPLGAAR